MTTIWRPRRHFRPVSPGRGAVRLEPRSWNRALSDFLQHAGRITARAMNNEISDYEMRIKEQWPVSTRPGDTEHSADTIESDVKVMGDDLVAAVGVGAPYAQDIYSDQVGGNAAEIVIYKPAPMMLARLASRVVSLWL